MSSTPAASTSSSETTSVASTSPSKHPLFGDLPDVPGSVRVLNIPESSDPAQLEKEAKIKSCLGRQVRIVNKDDRVLIGVVQCYDNLSNLIVEQVVCVRDDGTKEDLGVVFLTMSDVKSIAVRKASANPEATVPSSSSSTTSQS